MNSIFVCTVAVCLGLLSCPSYADSYPVNLRLSAETPIGKDGPIVDVLISNRSNHEVMFGSSVGDKIFDYDFVMHDEQGNLVPKTPLGRKMANEILGSTDPANYIVIGGSSHFVHLLPGASIRDALLLSEIYDLRRPGRYKLEVQREFNSEYGVRNIKSNRLWFVVPNQE